MGVGGTTLYRKIWDDHVIEKRADGTVLLLVDQVLIYEAGSAQAFDKLARRGAPVRRPKRILAVPDHAIPTSDRSPRALSGATQSLLDLLADNCAAHGIEHFGVDDDRQGIVHVIGPEQGLTLPGSMICCADSHTSTHGAFGAIAFGIGASELEHVLATQALVQHPSQTMRVTVQGQPGPGTSAKDIILAIIGTIGARGGTGHAVEFAGSAITRLSMEGRMTLCNMAIEAGARIGLIAPDETTYAWLKDRPRAPAGDLWDRALAYWRTLSSDHDAVFDREEVVDIAGLPPQVTWGTSPDQVTGVDGVVPSPATATNAEQAASWARALDYMGLTPGTPMRGLPVDRVFIGSCTNGRLEDLRAAAAMVRGRSVPSEVRAMAVPGSAAVRRQAEEEGLDRLFRDAGFEWRLPGCSMCFGSQFDSVAPGERCISTSNRNFENRQGRGARTHLASPAMAAAAAVAGHIVDIRELKSQ